MTKQSRAHRSYDRIPEFLGESVNYRSALCLVTFHARLLSLSLSLSLSHTHTHAQIHNALHCALWINPHEYCSDINECALWLYNENKES